MGLWGRGRRSMERLASMPIRRRGDWRKGWLEMGPAYNYEGLKLRASFSGEDKGSPNIEIDEANPERDPVQFTREADHFSECVLRNQMPRSPGEEGLRDMEYMEKIYASV